MPVYLFTFHAYKTWMPDHRRGYTRRGEGYCPSDPEMARNYEDKSKGEPSEFDPATSRALIDEAAKWASIVAVRLHAVTTESTHVHVLVSWKRERGWLSIRKSLKTSLTKRLNALKRGVAFSRGGSRKQVITRKHFNYLMETYLLDHSGVAWYEARGLRRPRK